MRKLSKQGTVIGTDVKPAPKDLNVPFEMCNVTDKSAVRALFDKHRPTHVVHLSAILSGAGERNPELALAVNLDGFANVLEQARLHGSQIFSPSTIAAFGPSTPPKRTPDLTVMRPTTVYGITKVHMELLGEYYHRRYGVDFRSIRLPGVISPEPIHGMGTTDYAVEIFQEASRCRSYTCYLKPDTRLPMLYIDDCLQAIAKLINAPNDDLTQRVYNIHGLDFTPAELAEGIRNQVDFDFQIDYKPDFRQPIAESWPQSLRDTAARRDWKWKPRIGSIDKLVRTMLANIRQ